MTDQRLGRVMHRRDVERPLDMPHAARLQSRRRPPVQDPVEIAAADRREPGVERVGHLRRLECGDRIRPQMVVQRVADLLRLPDAREIDMHDLAEGVDARVGAPGRRRLRRLADEFRECRLERGRNAAGDRGSQQEAGPDQPSGDIGVEVSGEVQHGATLPRRGAVDKRDCSTVPAAPTAHGWPEGCYARPCARLRARSLGLYKGISPKVGKCAESFTYFGRVR